MSDSDLFHPAPPPWLRPDIHAAMQTAYDREMAAGRGHTAAGAAACAVLLARLAGPEPPPEDGEAPDAAAVVAASGNAPPPGAAQRRLGEADVADLVAALAYALRYDARGKPRKGGWDHAADLAAEWLAEHLHRSNFVVLKRRPAPPHRAG